MNCFFGLTIVVSIGVIAAFWWVRVSNLLGGMRGKCEEIWSQIEIDRKLRHKLIPDLLESVKNHARSNSDVFQDAIRARQIALDAGGVEEIEKSEIALTESLKKLLDCVDGFPETGENEEYGKLKSEVEASTNALESNRLIYNDESKKYNSTCEGFPNLIVAGLSNFLPLEYLEESVTEPVIVSEA